jgi:hypothetical protein
MAWFKRNTNDNRGLQWSWDPQAANVSGEQAWALLTNAIYFRSVAPRLDTLGGGLEALDWAEGLATWWDVRDQREFEELVEWMQSEGYRTKWATDGVDGGDEKFAWDYCRLITVAGGAALAQVISSDRAWALVMDASDSLRDRFGSWSEVADNYLSGRILWLTDKGQWAPTPDPSQALFQSVADELLGDVASPWNRVSWDRSAGVLVDGHVLT